MILTGTKILIRCSEGLRLLGMAELSGAIEMLSNRTSELVICESCWA